MAAQTPVGGTTPPGEVLGALDGAPPPDAGDAMLDFDAALEDAAAPPLPFTDRSLELIWALSAFTRVTEGWAEWLLELRRLLADDGRLVVGLAGRDAFEQLTGRPWEESDLGMTVLAAPNGPGRIVFHSEWWLRAHWGPAFEITSIEETGGRRLVCLRSAGGEVAAEDLERPEAAEKRELSALRANVAYLGDQVDRAARLHRRELEEQREDLGRELMRRAYAEADRDWATRGPGSPGMLVAAEYEATTSWRITRPMRALGQMLRRLR